MSKIQIHFDESVISTKNRARFVNLFTIYFALIYHLIFLAVFYAIRLYPMAIFNIGSVTLFAFSAFYMRNHKNPDVLALLQTLEVVAHQLLCIYFLGSTSAFHFLILIIAVIPYLLYVDDLKRAVIISPVPLILFTVIEILGSERFPAHSTLHLEEYAYAIQVIRAVNISISILVILAVILIFELTVQFIEKNLEKEVQAQTEKLQSQNERIIEIQNNTIISLSNLVENRDSDTGEHVRRTSEYVNLLATKAMEAGYCPQTLTPHFIDLCTRAAPMHDIGKIVVSDLILKKNGKLTPEEFEQMKLHTTEGGRIIREILANTDDREYERLAVEIAEGHHEKWNGCGYPRVLKGEDIPLSARIMAVADVFDALVSPRCYKEPFSVEQSFKIIEESSGSHFDPVLAEIFLHNRPEIERILNRYTK